MMFQSITRIFIAFFFFLPNMVISQSKAFSNAADFGFLPSASGIDNVKALQKAVDIGGTIVVSQTGTYKMAGTVYLPSNTSLEFGNNVFIEKVNEQGSFSHVFLNKGALTRTYDQHISITGLNIIVNGIDVRAFKEAYGLHGQLAFYYVKDLKIDRFRCLDLEKLQYGIQICNFEDILVNDVIIKGMKDGVHLGRGKRFTISNGVFQTFDNAIALNAQDYSTGNPELGWIEDGVIENCHDLNAENTVGFFCRILAGGWVDWKQGMKVQQSDAVVSNGKIYRVQAQPDGTIYTSNTQPTHESGRKMIDGINWGVVQNDTFHTCGVRNVSFRNIFLEKPRVGLSIYFDNDKYSRSYYPNAPIPVQENLSFDNVRILHDKPIPFLEVYTPVNVVTISNSYFRNNPIAFYSNKAMYDYKKTSINIFGSVFNHDKPFNLLTNKVEGKEIFLKTSGNIEIHSGFEARVSSVNAKVSIESDLTGLKK